MRELIVRACARIGKGENPKCQRTVCDDRWEDWTEIDRFNAARDLASNGQFRSVWSIAMLNFVRWNAPDFDQSRTFSFRLSLNRRLRFFYVCSRIKETKLSRILLRLEGACDWKSSRGSRRENRISWSKNPVPRSSAAKTPFLNINCEPRRREVNKNKERARGRIRADLAISAAPARFRHGCMIHRGRLSRWPILTIRPGGDLTSVHTVGAGVSQMETEAREILWEDRGWKVEFRQPRIPRRGSIDRLIVQFLAIQLGDFQRFLSVQERWIWHQTWQRLAEKFDLKFCPLSFSKWFWQFN